MLSRNLDKAQTRNVDKKPLKQTQANYIIGTVYAKETLGNSNVSSNYLSGSC